MEQPICRDCGISFLPTGQRGPKPIRCPECKRRLQSERAKRYYRDNPQPSQALPKDKPCPYCGSLMARRRVQCGAPECFRRWNNERTKPHMERWRRARGIKPADPYDCGHCGKRCVPGENVVPHASKFCSADCKKRAWAEANPIEYEPVTALDQLERLIETGGNVFHAAEYRRAMRNDPCAYCGAPATALDHIEPSSMGGTDDWSNRTAACHSCNNSKWTMPLLLYLGYATTKRAFEPWKQVSTEWRRAAA